MRNVVTMLIVVLALAGCREPEDAVEKAGGKAPILCLRVDEKSTLHFCRDADKRAWVCTSKGDSSCALLDRVKATLDGVLPEQPSP